MERHEGKQLKILDDPEEHRIQSAHRFHQQIVGVFSFVKQLTNRELDTLFHRTYSSHLSQDQLQRIFHHLHPTSFAKKSKGENACLLNLLPSVSILTVRYPVMLR